MLKTMTITMMTTMMTTAAVVMWNDNNLNKVLTRKPLYIDKQLYIKKKRRISYSFQAKPLVLRDDLHLLYFASFLMTFILKSMRFFYCIILSISFGWSVSVSCGGECIFFFFSTLLIVQSRIFNCLYCLRVCLNEFFFNLPLFSRLILQFIALYSTKRLVLFYASLMD